MLLAILWFVAYKSSETSILVNSSKIRATHDEKLVETCFYKNNRKKCPSSIEETQKFGPGQYYLINEIRNSVLVHIVDEIVLENKLLISKPIYYNIVGKSIIGQIEVGHDSKVYMQDPTNTDFILNLSVQLKKISNLNTSLKAKSIVIQIDQYYEHLYKYSYDLYFYSGKPTIISFASTEYKGNFDHSLFSVNRKYDKNYVHISKINSTKDFSQEKIKINSDDDSEYEDTGTCGSDDVKYTYKSGIIRIFGKGVLYSNGVSSHWETKPYKELIVTVIIEEGITKLSYYVLTNLTNLQTISIPASVKTIDYYVLSDLKSLTTIELNENNEHFTLVDNVLYSKDMTILYKYPCRKTDTSFIVPETVTEIANNAFSYSNILKTVTLPNKIQVINSHTFEFCTGLKNINFPNNLSQISINAFANCYDLEEIALNEGIINIYRYAFFSCYSLKNVKIPENVELLDSYVFGQCYNLETIQLNNKITCLNEGSFYDCTSLKEFNFPTFLEKIYNEVFFNCISLTNMIIPDSIIFIGARSFANCTGIMNLKIPNSLNITGAYSFSNLSSLTELNIPDSMVSINYHAFSYCTGITEINIPDSVTRLYGCAFYYCTSVIKIKFAKNAEYFAGCFGNCHSLVNLTIPGNVYVGNFMFFNCTGLITLNISEGVTTIEHDAFYCCNSLTTVYLPSTLITLESAFYKCPNLKSVYYPRNYPPQCKDGPFDNLDVNIYVPYDFNETYFCHFDIIKGPPDNTSDINSSITIIPTNSPLPVIVEIDVNDLNFVEMNNQKTEMELHPYNFKSDNLNDIFLVVIPNQIKKISIPITNKYIQLEIPPTIPFDQEITIDAEKSQTTLFIDCIQGAKLVIPSDNNINLKGYGPIQIDSNDSPSIIPIQKVILNRQLPWINSKLLSVESMTLSSQNSNLNLNYIDVLYSQSIVGQKSPHQTTSQIIEIEPDSYLLVQDIAVQKVKIGLNSALEIADDSVNIEYFDIYFNSIYNNNEYVSIIFNQPFPSLINSYIKIVEKNMNLDDNFEFKLAVFNGNDKEECKKSCESINYLEDDVLDEAKCIENDYGYYLIARKKVSTGGNDPGSKSSSFPTVMVAIIVVVVIVIIVIIVIVVACIVKKRKKQQSSSENSAENI